MKGVSEFVVVLIILIIAIASLLVVWLFYNSMFGSVTAQGETSSLGDVLSSCMKIDSVSGNKTYLRNCGSGVIKSNNIRVYIDEIPYNFSMSTASIGKGGVGTVELNNIDNLSSGNHKLRIASSSGEVERFVKVVYSNASSEIIYLKFDEGSGNITYDSSSNHHDGTLQNIYPLDVIVSNPSLEDPWYLINNSDANHTTNAPQNWGSDKVFYNISTTTMLGQKETSIVKDGSSGFNMTFKSAGAFAGSFCLFSNDTINKFPINGSQYLEGGDFRYIIKGVGTTWGDLSFYFYNDTDKISRRWSNSTYDLDVDVGNGWHMRSYIWLPSSLDTNPPTQEGYIPYIPQGAKYGLFQQYFVYQGSNQDWQAMFDKFFIYQWPSMPTNNQRISRASSGWTDGKYGKALYFDGYNDYINASDSSSLDVSKFTISFWMFPISVSGYLVDKEEWDVGNEYGYEAHFWSDGKFKFLFGDGTSTQKYVNSTNPLSPNSWYYLTGTYDGSTFKIYINGVLNNSASFSTYPNYTFTTPLYIGADNGGDGYFNGIIDDVRIWNGALTQDEIQTVMNGGQIVTQGVATGLTLGETA